MPLPLLQNLNRCTNKQREQTFNTSILKYNGSENAMKKQVYC